MISIDNIKTILLEEKVIYYSKKESGKVIFNSNIYRILKVKDWIDVRGYLLNKYNDLAEFLGNFKDRDPREIIYCINNNLIHPEICPYCNIRYKGFNERGRKNNHYYRTCGDPNCKSKSTKTTSLEKYGTHHPLANKEVEEKRKATCLAKYGVEYSLQNPDIRKKIEKTNRDNHNGFWNNQLEEDKKKREETNRKNHNGLLECQTKEGKERRKETCRKKYGTDNPVQNKEIREKIAETNIRRYGYDNVFKSPEIQKRIQTTILNKYGYKSYTQTSEYKIQVRETNLRKYGVPYYTQTEECWDKIKATNQEKYGADFGFQNKEILNKWKETFKEKYGVENPSQVEEFQNKKTKRYSYKDLFFDSSWELAFFIKNEDKGIEYHSSSITYEDPEGKTHSYYPDFKINNKLFEIKGSHMIDSQGNLIDFYGKGENQSLFTAKQRCMEENNVVVISKKEIKPMIKEIKAERGADFFKNCRRN